MNARVHLAAGWTRVGCVSILGSAFQSGKHLAGERLAEVFTRVDSLDRAVEALCELNGFFSVVVERATEVVAAVDRIRSRPLFYAVPGEQFYLSDDARWIWHELNFPEYDSCSCVEFLLTGYVTGPFTLVDGIRQIRPGEVVWVDLKAGVVHAKRYYRFLHTNASYTSPAKLFHKLDMVTRSSIERLIKFAKGRPIVVPLSGGLDSRLIAMHLKLAGYSRVYAFSYGRPGNGESELSKEVARQLGIPWRFVPYSNELWKGWYASPEWKAYVRMAGGLSSVAHLQDWPAVWQLLKNGEIPQDAVFTPGHSADFVAGSHIPAEFLEAKRIALPSVVRAVRDHHYVLSSIASISRLIKVTSDFAMDCLEDRITKSIEDIPIYTVDDAVNAYEYWDWEERQAKFIVNSVRVYDFWQADWWLPWWDAEFMAFWQHVPLQYRISKRLYDSYVNKVQCRLGVSLPVPITRRVRLVLKRLPIGNLLREARQRMLAPGRRWAMLREYRTHPMGWFGIVDRDRYIELIHKNGNINTILAFDQLCSLYQDRKHNVTSGCGSVELVEQGESRG